MKHFIYLLLLLMAPSVTYGQEARNELPIQHISPSFQDSHQQPTVAQAQRVIQQTFAYFAAKDEQRFADAYSNFSTSQKQMVPFDGWKKHLVAFYDKAGAIKGRKIERITWYKNPPNTQPGIYAAVDFTSEFPNLSLHCGFLAWRQQMDGSFELVREEENSIEKTVAAKMTSEMMQRARSQFRC